MTNDPHSIIDQNAREQLSALLDGELDGDAARFLRRRLEHDDAMVGQLVRWQLAGDVLRAHADRPAQDDLASRVRAVIERESEPPAGVAAMPTADRRGGRWLWAGGLAAAAALGFAALNLGTQMPASPVAQPAVTAAAPALQTAHPAAAVPARNADIPAVGASPRVLATADAPSNANTGEADVPATAVVEEGHTQRSPRMLASAEGVDNSRQRIARATRAIGNPAVREKTSVAASESTALATAAASNDTARVVASATTARRNPFAIPAKTEAPALPWPKAAIPDLDSSLNASFNRSRGSNPFVPRTAIPAASDQPQP